MLALLGQWILSGFGAEEEVAAVPDNLEQRLVTLEQQPAAEPAPVDTAAVETLVQQQLAALLAEQTADGAADGGVSETDAVFQATLEATTGRLDTLESAEQARSTRLDQLERAIASGEAGDGASQSQAVSALSSTLDDVAAQVETLRTTVEGQSGPNPALAETVDGLGARIAEMQTANETALTSMADLRTDLSAQATALGDRLEALDARLTDIAANGESARQAAQQAAQSARTEIATALADLTGTTDARIAALTDRLENGADRVAARALAAAALKRDVDLGVPFTGTLDTLTSMSDDADALAPLTPYAETGVPTLATVQADFDSAADAMRDAVAPAPTDDSLTARLLAGARGAVQVRRSGDAAGGIEADIDTIDAAISSGDLAAASTAWQALPDPAKAASQNWHDDLTARLTADRFVSDVIDTSLRASSPAQDQ